MTLGKPLPLRSMYSTSLDVEPVDAEPDSSDTPAPTAVCAVWLSLAGAWAPAKSLADGTLMFGAPSHELLAEPALTQTFAVRPRQEPSCGDGVNRAAFVVRASD